MAISFPRRPLRPRRSDRSLNSSSHSSPEPMQPSATEQGDVRPSGAKSGAKSGRSRRAQLLTRQVGQMGQRLRSGGRSGGQLGGQSAEGRKAKGTKGTGAKVSGSKVAQFRNRGMNAAETRTGRRAARSLRMVGGALLQSLRVIWQRLMVLLRQIAGVHLSNADEREQRRSPQSIDRQSWSRLAIVWSILMIGLVCLLLNLLKIQLFQAPMLQERAREQQMVFFSPSPPRRQIVDRQGNVLAIDEPIYTLYAHRILFQDAADAVAAALAPIIRQPVNQLVQKLQTAESGVRLMDGLSEETARRVRKLNLDGLELIQQQHRVYPEAGLFANIVGYVNVDRQGQAGVELSEEQRLQRSTESVKLNRSGDGSIIPINLPPDFLQKDDLRLQLTLDNRLQRAAQFALKEQMDNFSAKRGAVIVMDVKDGAILALASDPTFDPNKFYESDISNLKNWVITDLYEPGSTFKPVNVAIALESGAVRMDDSFYDEGAIEIDGWPIQNSDFASAGGRGDMSLTEIIKYSSNVGMVHVMDQLQPGLYYGWLQKLGLDKASGIDLPSEAVGQMKTYEQFTESPIEPATTAFGQGFSLTPIKLLQLHSAIANGGTLVTPHVVQGLSDPSGNLKWQPTLASRKVFSAKNTRAILDMMEYVVDGGTGKAAQIYDYRIAGKTGTAQKADAGGGYIDGARITSFVGILPIDHPRYAVLAVVDEPQGEDAYGGTVAAPIVKAVMEAVITTERIPSTSAEEIINQALENQEKQSASETAPEDPKDSEATDLEEPALEEAW